MKGYASRVYIITVNWNGWRDTLECLASLERLDYPNYEIVVIDNGSTNESESRIRRAYPSTTLLQTGENLGFAGGNNVGIKYALEQGAEYVWLLNNDTVVDPGALTAMVNVLQDDMSIGVVGSMLFAMHEPDRLQVYGGGWVSMYTGLSRPFIAPTPANKLQYIVGASLLVRREVLENVGLLDDNYFMYWEDADYGFRVRKAGWRLMVAPGSKIWHKEFAALGKRSPVLDMYFSTSAVRFFKRHSLLPLLPISIAVGGRLLKRAVRGKWKRASAVWQGTSAGWRR